MIRFEDMCCGCATPSYPCMGSACPNRRVPHFICDKCGDDVEELYWWDDEKQWCIGCIEENLEKVEAE